MMNNVLIIHFQKAHYYIYFHSPIVYKNDITLILQIFTIGFFLQIVKVENYQVLPFENIFLKTPGSQKVSQHYCVKI